MSSIRVGMLLQYLPMHYGKFYPKLPRVPFSKDHTYFRTAYGTDDPHFIDYLIKKEAEELYGMKNDRKFTLLAAQLVDVKHPYLPYRPCTYVKCFISDPYQEGETIDGWVQTEWVTPLREASTYTEEAKENMRAIYFAMKKAKG